MRSQPQSTESEMAIIGCCISEPVKCIAEAQMIIKSDEYFYDLRNQTIWESLCRMQPPTVEMISLSQNLKDRGVIDQIGGFQYLNACQDAAISTANLPMWLSIVEEKWVLRRLIQTCQEVVSRVYEFGGTVNELLDEVERDVLAIRPSQRSSNDIKSLVNLAISKIENRFNLGNKISGLTTGLADLDRLTDGVHAGEVIVVAGFPSTGKTALGVNIAVGNALSGIPVAIFTAEMLPVQIVVRSLCSTARANFKYLVESDIPRMTSSAGRISRAPINIESASGLSAGQVMAIARRLKQKHNIQIIVVDYIQLLSGVGDNREQQVSSISKVMKAMALELDCAVLALSQLTDDGKLRESRAIGQDADSIWKLENDGDWKSHIQPIKLNVEKCRDGETGRVNLTFMKEFTRFENVSKISEEDVPQ